MARQSKCEWCFETYVVSFTYISVLQSFCHHGTPDILSRTGVVDCCRGPY